MRGKGKTYTPAPTGALRFPRWGQNQSWNEEPSGGWMAWMDDNCGLAISMDADQVNHFQGIAW